MLLFSYYLLMKHKDIEKLIQKSLDREITSQERAILHFHLKQCEDCNRLYQDLTQTGQSLDRLIEFFPQPGFNEQILRKINVKQRPSWAKAATVLAGAWLSMVAFLLLSPLPRQAYSQIMVAVPSLVRILNKFEIIINIAESLIAACKVSFDPTFPALGLISSILLFCLFGRIINPVRRFRKTSSLHVGARNS